MMIDTTLGSAQAGIALGGSAAGARRQPVGCVRGLLGLDLTV